ncbi:MAG: cation transporter [Oscillospiraceae bacterium]|nr:cation transporter [Oscillospiraceae bacterium]
MTQLLLRIFAKDATRSAVGRLSGIVGIVANLLLAGTKLLVGVLSGSVSITADAMNNLSDATSSIVTFVGFKLAEQPADEDHPFGHARYEYISALVVAGIVLIIGFELGKSSFAKILDPQPIEFSVIMLPVLVGSILVKCWLFAFNQKLGNLVDSNALLATAADSRNDCIATAAVLLSALLERFTGFVLDGYIGLAVSAFILYSGVTLARETISPLLGENASPELQSLIVDYVSSHPKVLGFHDLYVHDYGPGRRFASLHVEMDSREDPLLCHGIIDDLERECFASHGVQLVIHYDPIVTDDPELDRLHKIVDDALQVYDVRLTTHDFRMVQGPGHTNLIFDVVLPDTLRMRESAIRQHLLDRLANENTTYYLVITFDSAAFNANGLNSK